MKVIFVKETISSDLFESDSIWTIQLKNGHFTPNRTNSPKTGLEISMITQNENACTSQLCNNTKKDFPNIDIKRFMQLHWLQTLGAAIKGRRRG